MRKPQRWLCYLTCSISLAVGGSVRSVVRADPSVSPKPPAAVVKTPEIPASVLKDISRVHPGMTRADLDWLFTPDGGLSMVTNRSYIYRYAGVSVTMTDPTGKPLLDKVTHQPVVYGQAIKIDVTFKPAAGRAWATRTGQKTGLPFVSADGSPDDVIVSVSDPYVGFRNYD